MASEKRLIDVTPENIKAVLKEVPYYPDEIWKFTAMTERFPTVDAVEVVHGRWIWNEENECWVCSNCEMSALNNYRGNSTDSNYCPNCGAKMDGGNEDG